MDKMSYWVSQVEKDEDISVNTELLSRLFDRCEYIEKDYGYILYMIVEDLTGNTNCVVVNTFVKKEERSIDKVKELFNELELICKEKKCKSITVGHDLDNNKEKMFKLYKTLGYEEIASVRKVL